MSHSNDVPLDSHQLRVFVTLAKSGGFTQAGRDLHLTQSAVSHSIRALEGAAGCRLFDRMGKTAHLTPAGEQLLHHAVKILGENHAARAALSRRTQWGKSRLRVVLSPILAERRLADATRQFQRQLPDCPVRFSFAPESTAVDLLSAREADLAFGVAPPGDTRVVCSTVFVDELQWVVPDEHPWAKAGKADAKTLGTQPLVLPPGEDGTRRLVDEYLKLAGFAASPHIEIPGSAFALRMVRAGVGITLLAPWSAGDDASPVGLTWLPAGRRKLRRAWSAMTLRGQNPSLAAVTFTRIFAEVLART